ncbi:patatin-like phospholipase family protein [Streptomyces sp. NPDC000151]|uniref:patatin-like phospholipase family protein n=1 Tax=Streptomyces sp. NPDC000151 TaxID=3154244 RepID=UPI003317C8C0
MPETEPKTSQRETGSRTVSEGARRAAESKRASPSESRAQTSDGNIGVVMAGAGARGAYEAGMLATLLPKLDERRQRPGVFVGTSAGALNAALFASLAHLPAQQAADEALKVWRGITKNQVFEPFLPRAVPVVLRQYLAGLLNPSRASLSALLDTAPLRKTLQKKLDWRQLHDNLQNGTVQAVAVATTACYSGRTEIFVEGPRADRLPPSDADRAVDYTRAVLTEEHVLASAAIPVAFPPVRIGLAGGWYMDGGVRLNAPIKPAIELGVSRVAVIATAPVRYLPQPRGIGETEPSILDDSAQILNGLMADRMIEDVRTLGKMDELIKSSKPVKSPRGRDYEVIDYLFGGPAPGQYGQLGERAAYVLDTYFRGIRRLQNLDLSFLATLLGPGHSRGELLSYVLFEPEFINEAIKLGQQDAQLILSNAEEREGELLWRNDAVSAA